MEQFYSPFGQKVLDGTGYHSPAWEQFFMNLLGMSRIGKHMAYTPLPGQTGASQIVDQWRYEDGNAAFIFYCAAADTGVDGLKDVMQAGILGTTWDDSGTMSGTTFELLLPAQGDTTDLSFAFVVTDDGGAPPIPQYVTLQLTATNTYDLKLLRILL